MKFSEPAAWLKTETGPARKRIKRDASNLFAQQRPRFQNPRLIARLLTGHAPLGHNVSVATRRIFLTPSQLLDVDVIKFFLKIQIEFIQSQFETWIYGFDDFNDDIGVIIWNEFQL